MKPEPEAAAQPPERAPAPTTINVLYIDADLVVVDKPAGILSAGGRGPGVTAADLLRNTGVVRSEDPLRIVHRLDRDASGILIYARTLPAQQGLVRQFAERQVEKRYLALVSGYVAEDGAVNLSLTFDRRTNRVRAGRSGKRALTRYRIAERVAGNTLLECELVTGRHHQIRAHMAAIGHPLTVDPTYGGGQAVLLSHYKRGYRPSGRRPERPLIERLTLHAASIQFVHPVTQAAMAFEAPLPKDLRATVHQLARLV